MAEQLPSAARAEVVDDGDATRNERKADIREAASLPPPPPEPAGEGPDKASPHARESDAARATMQRQAPNQRQAYAAIDLGTNNCRLLIARPAGANFIVIDAFSRVVRLGEGLAQTGRLSQAAMDRALSALHVCADK